MERWMREREDDLLAMIEDSLQNGDFEMAALNKRAPAMDRSLETRFAKVSKADWADLYFDLYRQTCGDEMASDEECMRDAEKRLDILKIYRENT